MRYTKKDLNEDILQAGMEDGRSYHLAVRSSDYDNRYAVGEVRHYEYGGYGETYADPIGTGYFSKTPKEAWFRFEKYGRTLEGQMSNPVSYEELAMSSHYLNNWAQGVLNKLENNVRPA